MGEPLESWILSLSTKEYEQEMDSPMLRRIYREAVATSDNVCYRGQLLKKGEKIVIPDNIDRVGDSAFWDMQRHLVTLGKVIKFTASGVLCQQCLKYAPMPTRGGMWDGLEFSCKGLFCQESPHLHMWPLPCVVRAWWSDYEDLPLEPLKPYLENIKMSFDELATLLAVGAPWA